MNQQGVKPITKDRARLFAIEVLQKELDCVVENTKFIGAGSYGYVYLCKINKEPFRVIMKACRVDGMCRQESYAIKLLSEGSPTPLPKIYFTFYGNDCIPLDFICEEFIEGSNCFAAKFLFKSRKVKKQFAERIVDTMAVWHSKTNDKFGFLEDPNCETWTDHYKPFAFDILQKARKYEGLDKNVLRTMEKAFEHFDFIFSEPVEQASLIHGDLNVLNILANSALEPTGIIDPLESRWADKEYDLFQLRNLTGEFFGLYKTYKKKYPVSANCDIKCAFYALYNEVYCGMKMGKFYKILLYPICRRMNKELKRIKSMPHDSECCIAQSDVPKF